MEVEFLEGEGCVTWTVLCLYKGSFLAAEECYCGIATSKRRWAGEADDFFAMSGVGYQL